MLDISLDYVWEIQYRDGSVLKQFNSEGEEQPLDLKAVSEKQIARAIWHPLDPTRRPALVNIPEDGKLIIFVRNYESPNKQVKYNLYVLGFEKPNEEGRVEKTITFIQPSHVAQKSHAGKDGKIFRTVHKFRGAVETSNDSEFDVAFQRWSREVQAYNPGG